MRLRFAHEFPNWKGKRYLSRLLWGKYPGATESARATLLATAWACQLFLEKQRVPLEESSNRIDQIGEQD